MTTRSPSIDPTRRAARAPALLRFVAACLLALLAPATRAGEGTLIVLNKSDDTATLIDLAEGGRTLTLPTGGGPHEVAVSPDGRTAVVADYGTARNGSWVNGHTLTVLELPAGTVRDTIDLQLNEQPHGIQFLPGGEQVLVTAESRAAVVVVDVARGRVLRSVPTEARGSHMVVASPDGKRAYTANMGSASVSVLDLEEGRLLAQVDTGAECEGIDVTPDGRQVWASNRAAGTLSVIDTETHEVLAELPCAGFPIRVKITPDGRRALVSCATASEVAVFDVASREELGRVVISADIVDEAGQRLFGAAMEGSPTPIGVLVPPDGKRAYVAAANADQVLEVDLETLTVVRGMRTGREPDGLGWSPLALAPADDEAEHGDHAEHMEHGGHLGDDGDGER